MTLTEPVSGIAPVCTPWEGPLPYPVHYPHEEPTDEQRRVIEQWRTDIGKLGINRDRLVFSPDEMRRVKGMSEAEFIEYITGVIRDRRVELTVTGIPEGCRLTAADLSLEVVLDIGHRAYMWLCAQARMRRIHHARFLMECLWREIGDAPEVLERLTLVSDRAGEIRREIMSRVVSTVHSTTGVIVPDTAIRRDEDGGTVGDEDTLRSVEQMFGEVTHLFPDFLKDNTAGLPPLAVLPIEHGRSLYHARFDIGGSPVDGMSVMAVTPDHSSLVHELMHRLQHGNHHLRALESRLVERRTAASHPVRWESDPFPCIPGTFVSPYMGTVYPNGLREVLTTGMEMLYFGRFGAGIGAAVDDGSGWLRTDKTSGLAVSDNLHLEFTLGALLAVPLG